MRIKNSMKIWLGRDRECGRKFGSVLFFVGNFCHTLFVRKFGRTESSVYHYISSSINLLLLKSDIPMNLLSLSSNGICS